jgi:copper chaperone CopZ
MRILSSVVLTLLMLIVPMSAAADQQPAKPVTQVCTLKVSGMTCAGCEVSVRLAARSVTGVTEVKASYAKGNAEVTYDPAKTTPAAIAKAITDKSGFKAEAPPAVEKSRK